LPSIEAYVHNALEIVIPISVIFAIGLFFCRWDFFDGLCVIL